MSVCSCRDQLKALCAFPQFKDRHLVEVLASCPVAGLGLASLAQSLIVTSHSSWSPIFPIVSDGEAGVAKTEVLAWDHTQCTEGWWPRCTLACGSPVSLPFFLQGPVSRSPENFASYPLAFRDTCCPCLSKSLLLQH